MSHAVYIQLFYYVLPVAQTFQSSSVHPPIPDAHTMPTAPSKVGYTWVYKIWPDSIFIFKQRTAKTPI